MQTSRYLLPALGLLAAACQTGRPLSPTGLYRTAADYRQQRPALAGSSAGKVFLARKAYVRTGPDGHTLVKVPLDSIWGFANSNHETYRYYKRHPYQVEQADTLTIYSVMRTSSNGKQTYTHYDYYFSTGLGGPVERLTRKQLRRSFATNSRFLELLGTVRWYQSLASYEKPTDGNRSFRVVALYREALGLPAFYPR